MQLVRIPIQTNEFPNPEIKEGDTIPVIEFDFQDTLIDLTGSVIRIQLYDEEGKITSQVSTGNGITILTSKKFNINEVPKESNLLKAGNHRGDVEITLPNTKRTTYCDILYVITKEYTK